MQKGENPKNGKNIEKRERRNRNETQTNPQIIIIIRESDICTQKDCIIRTRASLMYSIVVQVKGEIRSELKTMQDRGYGRATRINAKKTER